MGLPAAFLGVILIWSTTPLCIKWSGMGPGFLFGATARMALSLPLCLMLLWLLRQSLPRDRAAWRVYAIAGIQVYASMMATYWAAQHISSGLISVLFGLTPLITGVLAAPILGERALTPAKLAGMATGLAGLLVIFDTSLDRASTSGVIAALLGIGMQALSAVLLKRYDPGLPALATTTGALIVGVPCYLLTWLLTGQTWPEQLNARAAGAIVYLAVLGSTVGFVLYYYILRHTGASKAALITLVTPVGALLVGHVLDQEPLGPAIWYGTSLILAGLAIHQWGSAVFARVRGRLAI